MNEKTIVGTVASIAEMIEKKSNCQVELVQFWAGADKHCDIILAPEGLDWRKVPVTITMPYVVMPSAESNSITGGIYVLGAAADTTNPDNNWQWISAGSSLWLKLSDADRQCIGGAGDDNRECFVKVTALTKSKLEQQVDRMLIECGLDKKPSFTSTEQGEKPVKEYRFNNKTSSADTDPADQPVIKITR